MTEPERINYEILKFLASSNVREDINITDETLAHHLRQFDSKIFESQKKGLIIEKAIAKTSSNKQWQITQVGEVELNRLARELVKDNPVAKEIQDDLTQTTIKNLILQNKLLEIQIPQAKFKYRDAIIGFCCAGILSIAISYINKPEQVDLTKLKIEPFRISIDKSSSLKDTLYIKTDSLK